MTTTRHVTTRSIDEIQCSCGLTWGIHEDDPHPIVNIVEHITESQLNEFEEAMLYAVAKSLEIPERLLKVHRGKSAEEFAKFIRKERSKRLEKETVDKILKDLED